jgi:dTDP-4-amino-4,6-dideoxygalactose transaminase
MKPIGWSNLPLPLIQVNPPSVEASVKLIDVAYSNGIFSNSAELQRLASETLSKHVNSEFSGYLASNNTMALTACLLSIGVRGKHVIVSNFTFAATLDAVILAGGIPLVCDIDEESLVLNFEDVKHFLDSPEFAIAAVVPTRVLGFVTDLSELVQLCDTFKVPVVVDAAACFPARSNSWNFQSQAKFEVFSLHATKVFGIGEGGLVVGSAEGISDVRSKSNFGLVHGVNGFTDGLNAKADEFTASRALARFPMYKLDVNRRQEFVSAYQEILSTSQFIRLIQGNDFTVYSYFPLIFQSEESMLEFQQALNPFLTTRRYYFPTIKSGYMGDSQVYFSKKLDISEALAPRILCLPVYFLYEQELLLEIKSLIKSAAASIR